MFSSFSPGEVFPPGGLARARLKENINEILKRFDILDNRFRYDSKKHRVVFTAGLVLVQYDIENGRPLLSVL